MLGSSPDWLGGEVGAWPGRHRRHEDLGRAGGTFS
jgi:hypothetical protein